MTFFEQLTNVKNIEEALLQYCHTHPYFLSTTYNPNAPELRKNLLHRRPFAKALSKELVSETFHFGRAKIIEIKPQPDKVRLIHQFSFKDQLVMKLMGQACMPTLEQQMVPTVFSYLPGRSHLDAVRCICQYLKKHRDVYLLRTDITHYTDSILMTPNAPLWKVLEEFITDIDQSNIVPPYVLPLFKEALRPVIDVDGEPSYQQWRGIAMGTALTPIIANLYLASLDKLMLSKGLELYMRFGDDIILADTSKKRLESCNNVFGQKLKDLHLIRQPDKDQCYYLNRAGRKTENSDIFKGSVCFEYLGAKIFATGGVALPNLKQRKILHDIYQRIDRLNKLLQDKPLEERGKILCQSISSAFTNAPLATFYQDLLTQVVSARAQLKQLDYLIARHIVYKLTGMKDARAFRKVSYKQLREWGLISLCYLRNKPKIKAEINV
jgi:hypothetical protein